VRRFPSLLGLLLICFCKDASAQEKPPVWSVTPTAGPRLEFLDEVSYYEQRYLRLADAIPAEKYNWRPSEGVRTVGEVFAHIANSNYAFARMLGTPSPTGIDAKAITASAGDKAKVIQELKDSFVHFRNAVLAIKDSELDKEIKGPRGQTTIRGSFFLICGHFGEHLGQSIAYARSIGIVPPWTAERLRQEPEKSNP
jgi:uncharacterized damage-inducible protein DinB